MDRKELLLALAQYRRFPNEPPDTAQRMISFLEREPQAFSRKCLEGHFTGSALVFLRDPLRILLVHHRKLNKWLQPGGHADGEDNLIRVAQREVQEECGITDLALYSPRPFDLDIHQIPERGHEPAHLHYDVRFLFSSAAEQTLSRQEAEIKEARWVPVDDVESYQTDTSVLRLRNKLTRLDW